MFVAVWGGKTSTCALVSLDVLNVYVNVFINGLIWTWNTNGTGARLSYVSKCAVGKVLWLEPSEGEQFKWRLKSLVWLLDISDKLFRHTADKGEMEQQYWITLCMGSILIDILTWKENVFAKFSWSVPPMAPRRDIFEHWGAMVVCCINQKQC